MKLWILKHIIKCSDDELKYFAAKELHKKLYSGIHGKVMQPWSGIKIKED